MLASGTGFMHAATRMALYSVANELMSALVVPGMSSTETSPGAPAVDPVTFAGQLGAAVSWLISVCTAGVPVDEVASVEVTGFDDDAALALAVVVFAGAADFGAVVAVLAALADESDVVPPVVPASARGRLAPVCDVSAELDATKLTPPTDEPGTANTLLVA